MNAYLKWRAGLPLDVEERAELRDYKRVLRNRVDRMRTRLYYCPTTKEGNAQALKISNAISATQATLEDLERI